MKFHNQECELRAKCGFPHLTKDHPSCVCQCHEVTTDLPRRIKGMMYPLKVAD